MAIKKQAEPEKDDLKSTQALAELFPDMKDVALTKTERIQLLN